MKPVDYLSYYASKFDTVEVDSTFYGTPSASTVKAWNAKTPPGFVFAAKVPQTITHEKVLLDCDAEFNEFIEAMDNLGEKLGSPSFSVRIFQQISLWRCERLPSSAETVLEETPEGSQVRRRDPKQELARPAVHGDLA
jgi:hypothetical protein